MTIPAALTAAVIPNCTIREQMKVHTAIMPAAAVQRILHLPKPVTDFLKITLQVNQMFSLLPAAAAAVLSLSMRIRHGITMVMVVLVEDLKAAVSITMQVFITLQLRLPEVLRLHTVKSTLMEHKRLMVTVHSDRVAQMVNSVRNLQVVQAAAAAAGTAAVRPVFRAAAAVQAISEQMQALM